MRWRRQEELNVGTLILPLMKYNSSLKCEKLLIPIKINIKYKQNNSNTGIQLESNQTHLIHKVRTRIFFNQTHLIHEDRTRIFYNETHLIHEIRYSIIKHIYITKYI